MATLAVVGCGSSSNASVGDGGSTSAAAPACTTGMDCNPQECVCMDGHRTQTGVACVQGSCVVNDGTSFCASACYSHGGVTTIHPSPNVARSAECDAWCGKVAALQCGPSTCDRFVFCRVPEGSCEAATLAVLQCTVDTGQWACGQHGGWGVTASCSTFKELCTGADAGSD